jgi:hypothetical protein
VHDRDQVSVNVKRGAGFGMSKDFLYDQNWNTVILHIETLYLHLESTFLEHYTWEISLYEQGYDPDNHAGQHHSSSCAESYGLNLPRIIFSNGFPILVFHPQLVKALK